MSAIAPAHSPERSPILRKGRKGLVMVKSAHPQVLSAVTGSVFRSWCGGSKFYHPRMVVQASARETRRIAPNQLALLFCKCR